MAVLALKSADLEGADAFPKVLASPVNRSKMRRHHFVLPPVAVAGDIGTTIDLVRLPRGSVRVYLQSSRIYWSAFGAARVLDIGHRAYKTADDTPIAAAPALFDDNINVAASGNAALGSSFVQPAGTLAQNNRFLSETGITIFATVAGGTIPVGAILEGWIDYAEI